MKQHGPAEEIALCALKEKMAREEASARDIKLVSVVVPTYNAEKFIERTLASICAQTYKHLEIIVVNDGSVDATSAIVTSMAEKDSRIRLISTENRGVAAARNLGTDAAVGEYVAFIDADDLWHKTKIEKQVRALDVLPIEWAAVYTLHWIIDEHDKITRPGPYNHARGYIFARHISMRFIGNGSALLVRRPVVKEVGGFDPSYAAAQIGGCEDVDFELRVAEKYLIEVVPERLVGYRMHGNAMSTNHLRMAFSLQETVDRALRRNAQLDGYAASSARISTYRYALLAFLQARKTGLALQTAGWLAVRHGAGLVGMTGRLFLKILSRLVMRSRPKSGMSKTNFEDAVPSPVTEIYYDEFQTRRRAERLAAIDFALGESLEAAASGRPQAPVQVTKPV